MLTLFVPSTVGFAPACSPVPVERLRMRPDRRISMLDAAAAVAALGAAQEDAMGYLVQELPLYEDGGWDTALGGGVEGSVRSFIPEPPKVHLGLEASRAAAQGERESVRRSDCSWASSLSIRGSEYGLSTLTLWNAPVIEVPHFFSSVGVSDGGIDVHFDFRPRLDAGYDQALPDGSYAEPTT